MSAPFTQPPATVTYIVRIGSGEWAEYKTPVKSSKFVADNIYAGYEATVVFKDAVSVETVRDNFNARISAWLRELGHNGEFHAEPTTDGAFYSRVK
jgi:hypothetical protein